MSTVALYQKYRSRTFDEIVGQEYVVRAIRNAVKENKVGHAYLFCGPRGTGKTSMARLLARAVNCQNPSLAPCNECPDCLAAIEGTHPDIIEINAANETHVEDIRDLIDRARLSPMMGHHKIYIIDEVHQLSSSAASALLKILEEPPEHVIFILATTDPQKLLKTIISRCQRFDFSRVDTSKIRDHLLSIAEKEGFTLDEAAAMKIAELADGGMRDSLSILEQARAYGSGVITEDVIDSIFGLASSSERISLLHDILDGDMAEVLKRLSSCEEHGVDVQRLSEDLITALKDGLIFRYTGSDALLHSLTREQAAGLSDAGSDVLLSMIDSLMKAQERFRFSRSAATVFEIACLEMMAQKKPAPAVSEKIPAEKPAGTERVSRVKHETVPAAVTETVTEKTENNGTSDRSVIETVTEETNDLTSEEVLSILVQCAKSFRSVDGEAIRALATSIPANRYSALLKQLNFCTSGPDAIIFTGTQSAVHLASEPGFHREFYFYLKDHGLDKMPFLVTADVYENAVSRFRTCYQSGTLPEPMEVERYRREPEKTEEEKTIDIEQKVIDLFGKENISIVEEGE